MFTATFFVRVLALAVLTAAGSLAAPHAAGLPQDRSAPRGVLAPFELSGDGRVETRHLTVRLSSSPSAAAPGTRIVLVAEITPKPKMHVYAPDQKDVIPVSLAITPSPGVRVGTPRLPPSERYFFAPLNETQRVYSKTFRIEQPVTVADTAATRARARAGDPLVVTARLRYQACDDTICYLPQDLPLTWTVTLRPS